MPPVSDRIVSQARPLADCLPIGLRELALPAKMAWVDAVYSALKFPWPKGTLLAERERGAFASLYDRLAALPLPESVKLEILAHDVLWCREKGLHKRNHKKGAVFTKVHKDRVATAMLRAPPRR